MRKSGLVAVAVLACLPACGCLRARQPENVVMFTGKVVDSSTQKPLPGARLQLEVRFIASRLTAYGVSNPKGRFMLSLRLPKQVRSDPNLTCRLWASAKGYRPVAQVMRMTDLQGTGGARQWPVLAMVSIKPARTIPWKK
ncbi:MAG: hypothetical protein QGD94_00285 [Planctomycetia bacterium]|nr:hypothetical protein [Planctomycetia bacterium]